MNNRYVIVTIIILILVAIFYFFYNKMAKSPVSLIESSAPGDVQENVNQQINSSAIENQKTQTGDASEVKPVPKENTVIDSSKIQTNKKQDIIYTDSGYLPSMLVIKEGDTVVFKNQSSFEMWTASATHPSHSAYSSTSLEQHCPDTANVFFDECKSVQSGESWSFTFTKTGNWGYHNHVKTSHLGKITVE